MIAKANYALAVKSCRNFAVRYYVYSDEAMTNFTLHRIVPVKKGM